MAVNVLQTDSGDIYVGADGSTRWTATLEEEASQRLRQKYQLFRGEWFLDTREGVPYWDMLGAKPINEQALRSVLRRVASEDPAVAVVEQFDTSFDSAARHLTVALTVRLVDGEVLELEPFTL